MHRPTIITKRAFGQYAGLVALASLIMFSVNYYLAVSNIVYHNTVNRVTIVSDYKLFITRHQILDEIIIIGISSYLLIIATTSISLMYQRLAVSLVVICVILTFYFLQFGLLLIFSLPLLSAIVYIIVRKESLRQELEAFVSIIFSLLIILEFASLVRWASYPIYPTPIYTDLSWHFASLESSYFYIIGQLSAYLIILISLNYIVSPLSRSFSFIEDTRKVITEKFGKLEGIKKQSYYIGIGVILALSILLPLWPHIQTINPKLHYISTDVPFYSSILSQIDSDITNDENFVLKVFNEYSEGDRPLTLLVLLSIHKMLDISHEDLLTYIPSFLSPLLIVSIIFLVASGGYNKSVILLSALMTLLSYQVIVGVYAGLTANWFGLVAGYFMLGLILNALHKNTYVVTRMFIIAAASLAVFLLHFYSGIFFALVGISFLTWMLFRKKNDSIQRRRITLLLLLMIFLTSIALVNDIIRSATVNISSNIGRTTSFMTEWGGLEEFEKRWQNLKYATLIYHGSFFTNTVLYAVVLVWIILFKHENPVDKLILVMFSLSSITFLFTDYNISSRILLDLPMQIPFAIVLTYLMFHNQKKSSSRFRFSSKQLTAVFFLLYFWVYALRSLSNMYFISPF